MALSATTLHQFIPGASRFVPGTPYRNNYSDSSTVSLWEFLAESDFFPFPDYKGQKMTIIDACPTRNHMIVQKTIRTLLYRMNIQLIEPEKNTCCGDSF